MVNYRVENTFPKIKNVVFLMRKSFFCRQKSTFEKASRPVSRVLFFRQPSILVRCCQRHRATFSRRNEQPHGLCLSCFGWGLQGPATLPPQRWALTPPFHPYLPKDRRFISVALSLESPPPAVSRHPALRSPDFPHSYERDCPTYSHNPNHYK